MPRMVSKAEIASRPMTSTSRVLKARCTSTLSMTTWKNSGETSANSCRKNDARSSSLRRWRYLRIAPRNQVMSNRRVTSDSLARRVMRINSPSQTASSSACVIKAGRDVCGDCTRTLSSAALGEHHEPAVAQRCDRRQGRPDKPRPIGAVGPCLEPKVLGAPEHLRCADFGCSKPMPDLFAISRNALEVQQRHEGFEPRIGWARAVGYSAHLSSLWLAASGVRLRQQRLLVRRLIGDRRRTV